MKMVKRMSKEEKYKKIVEEVKKTRMQLKKMHKNVGTFENPVDTDLVKTTKAMFYERVLEILTTKGDK